MCQPIPLLIFLYKAIYCDLRYIMTHLLLIFCPTIKTVTHLPTDVHGILQADVSQISTTYLVMQPNQPTR